MNTSKNRNNLKLKILKVHFFGSSYFLNELLIRVYFSFNRNMRKIERFASQRFQKWAGSRFQLYIDHWWMSMSSSINCSITLCWNWPLWRMYFSAELISNKLDRREIRTWRRSSEKQDIAHMWGFPDHFCNMWSRVILLQKQTVFLHCRYNENRQYFGFIKDVVLQSENYCSNSSSNYQDPLHIYHVGRMHSRRIVLLEIVTWASFCRKSSVND